MTLIILWFLSDHWGKASSNSLHCRPVYWYRIISHLTHLLLLSRRLSLLLEFLYLKIAVTFPVLWLLVKVPCFTNSNKTHALCLDLFTNSMHFVMGWLSSSETNTLAIPIPCYTQSRALPHAQNCPTSSSSTVFDEAKSNALKQACNLRPWIHCLGTQLTGSVLAYLASLRHHS